LGATEMLHAEAAGEFPVARPLIIAADIEDVARMDSGERGADLDARVLYAGKQPARLILVERIVEFEDIGEGGAGQRVVGDGLGVGRLPGDGRDPAAVLLMDIGLEADIPARDVE